MISRFRALRLPTVAIVGLVLTAMAAVTATLAPPVAADTAERKATVDAAVEDARDALEGSSTELQRAGAALAEVEARLPAARQTEAAAHERLAAAQAAKAETETALRRAEAAVAAAHRRSEDAAGELTDSQQTLGGMARDAYQRGPLSSVAAVLVADSSGDLFSRVGLLHAVFQHQEVVIDRLRIQRGRLAVLEDEERAGRARAEDARAAAAATVDRTATAYGEAEAAADQVAALVAQREAALAVAERERATDAARYQELRAKSAELAEQLRAEAEAAREAAAREAARREQRDNQGDGGDRPSATASSGELRRPVAGPITSSFGYRVHPLYGTRRLHAGIDIGVGTGTSIHAAAAGRVVSAGWVSGYGRYTVISHGLVDGDGLATTYAHQSAILVSAGEHVAAGETIGRVGASGNVTGPHLHFEVRRDGTPVDPMPYLR